MAHPDEFLWLLLSLSCYVFIITQWDTLVPYTCVLVALSPPLRNICVDMYGFWFEAGPILSFAACKLFKQIFNKDSSLLPRGYSLRRVFASLRSVFWIRLLCICQGWKEVLILGADRALNLYLGKSLRSLREWWLVMITLNHKSWLNWIIS